MEWWAQLLMTAATVAVTAVVTFVVNYVLNGPKRRKEEEQKREAEQKQHEDEQMKRFEETMNASVKNVNEKMDYILSIYAKSREDSINERKKLYDTIEKINLSIDERMSIMEEMNKKQSHGIQVLLRRELKKLYQECLSYGYAPVEIRDETEEMYQVYHSLGKNGSINSLREQFLNLPIDRDTKNQK